VPVPGACAVTLTWTVSVPPKSMEPGGAIVVVVDAALTAWLSVAFEALWLLSPEYTALRLCEATLKVGTAQAAEASVDPATTMIEGHSVVPPVHVASDGEVAPSQNVTLPVGMAPPAGGATVAVSIVLWPKTVAAGFADSVAVVAYGSTTCSTAAAVAGPLFASPEKYAVIECVPTARRVTQVTLVELAGIVHKGAFPPQVASVVAASAQNMTVLPFSVPLLASVAVNVTFATAPLGLPDVDSDSVGAARPT
jgi:hypothetical protein